MVLLIVNDHREQRVNCATMTFESKMQCSVESTHHCNTHQATNGRHSMAIAEQPTHTQLHFIASTMYFAIRASGFIRSRAHVRFFFCFVAGCTNAIAYYSFCSQNIQTYNTRTYISFVCSDDKNLFPDGWCRVWVLCMHAHTQTPPVIINIHVHCEYTLN